MKKRLAALFIATFLAVSLPRAAQAMDGAEAGLWTGAVFGSLLYTPLKGVFALLMGLGGGLSYAVTIPMDNTDLSNQILGWGFYGDWMLRPEHLVLDEYPQFVGFDEEVRFID
jgi:hypothetical protein